MWCTEEATGVFLHVPAEIKLLPASGLLYCLEVDTFQLLFAEANNNLLWASTAPMIAQSPPYSIHSLDRVGWSKRKTISAILHQQ